VKSELVLGINGVSPAVSIRDPGGGEECLLTRLARHPTSLWQASFRSEWETGGKSRHPEINT